MTTDPETGKAVYGMVHLAPLPGTPYHVPGSLADTIETAVRSARALAAGGATGALVQTVDRVYRTDDHCDPARLAAVTMVVRAIVEAVPGDFEVGVQIMQNAICASLAVARVAGGSFVRASALVGATLTTHGMVTAQPLQVMEYRAKLGAEGIRIVADIATQHYRWLGDERTIGDRARAAAQVGADAVAVADPEPSRALAMIDEIRAAAPKLPVFVAGYTNHANAAALLGPANGGFVGSCIERGGWGGEIDPDLVRTYLAEVESADPAW